MEPVINSEDSTEWRRAELNRWGELDEEGQKSCTTLGAAVKSRRAGGIPGVSVAPREALGCCRVLWSLWRAGGACRIFSSLLSLNLSFPGRTTPLLLYLWLFLLWCWSSFLLPQVTMYLYTLARSPLTLLQYFPSPPLPPSAAFAHLSYQCCMRREG